ncbi:hypothetical protein JOF40_002850 [Aeromicrobium fastidiosum]|nr:hypothetical protein [Aeromicrobium fastidiosum]
MYLVPRALKNPHNREISRTRRDAPRSRYVLPVPRRHAANGPPRILTKSDRTAVAWLLVAVVAILAPAIAAKQKAYESGAIPRPNFDYRDPRPFPGSIISFESTGRIVVLVAAEIGDRRHWYCQPSTTPDTAQCLLSADEYRDVVGGYTEDLTSLIDPSANQDDGNSLDLPQWVPTVGSGLGYLIIFVVLLRWVAATLWEGWKSREDVEAALASVRNTPKRWRRWRRARHESRRHKRSA